MDASRFRSTPASSDNRKALIAFAGLFCLLAYWVHFWPNFHWPNESIRLYFVQAFVDHGTPAVDGPLARYGRGNVDLSSFEGHSYMDKAPGLSLVVMPLYWVLTRVFGMSTEFAELPALSHLLLLFGVTLPATLGAYCVYRIVRTDTGDPGLGYFAGLTTGLATPYALYATLFFGHGLAAACAIFSVFSLRKNLFLAGAFAGAMVLVDTAACALAVAIGLWAGARTRSFRSMVEFGIGGVPFVAAQLAYNAWLFDDPLKFAYAYKARANFAAIHGQGVLGFGIPAFEALWGLTFGTMRGLFYHSPVLMLAFLGGRRARPLLAISLVHFLWISAFVDWPAGWSYTPRHLVPVVPLLMIAAAYAVADHRFLLRVAPVLTVYSAVLTLAMISTFPYALGTLDDPLRQAALPMMMRGSIAPSALGLTGFTALLPPLVLLAGLVLWLTPWARMAQGSLGLVGIAVLVAIPMTLDSGQLRSRTRSEMLNGYPQHAAATCKAYEDHHWNERNRACYPNGPRRARRPESRQ